MFNDFFQVRTKHEPQKWPIKDVAAERIQEIQMPPPSLSKKIQNENLNPNVPEFIPCDNTSKTAGNPKNEVELMKKLSLS